MKVDPANLYRALRRMRRDGWIEEVEAGDGEDRRRTYSITGRGQSVLRREVDRLERLLSDVRPTLAALGRAR